jgi:hypothetical protein
LIGAVQASGIARGKPERKRRGGIAPGHHPADRIYHELHGGRHAGTEIRAVEDEAIDQIPVLALGRPQRDDQAPGRMPAHQDRLVTFPLDDADRGIDFGIVLPQGLT